MQIKESELILNPDGSIYHLNLKPGDIANTILTVGDPERVDQVTAHFDTIENVAESREFRTKTGIYKGMRLTVISTGIGTDNIDIVLNELDALVNIDFKTRQVKNALTSLRIIRIGTTGCIQSDIPVDKFVVSERAIGFDNLLHFYKKTASFDTDFSEALKEFTQWNSKNSDPYVVSGDPELVTLFTSEECVKGITSTNSGFYGPQGRILRLALHDDTLNSKLEQFRYKGKSITNLEMETAGIYGLSHLLGHKAISLSVILANRANGTFSKNPKAAVENLIQYTLERLFS